MFCDYDARGGRATRAHPIPTMARWQLVFDIR
jgi:hypothetical protein